MSQFREMVGTAYEAAPELIVHEGQLVVPGSVLHRGGGDLSAIGEQDEAVDLQMIPDETRIIFPDVWEGQPHQIVVGSIDELHGVLAEIAEQFFGGKTTQAQHILGGQLNHEMQHVGYAQTYFDAAGIRIAVNVFRIPENCGFTPFPGALPVALTAGVHYVGGSATKLDFAGASGKPIQLSPEDRAIVDSYYGSLEKLAVRLEAAGRPLPNSLTMLQNTTEQEPVQSGRPAASASDSADVPPRSLSAPSETANSSQGAAIQKVAEGIARAIALLPAGMENSGAHIEAASEAIAALTDGSEDPAITEALTTLKAVTASFRKVGEQLQQGREGLETYLGDAGVAGILQPHR